MKFLQHLTAAFVGLAVGVSANLPSACTTSGISPARAAAVKAAFASSKVIPDVVPDIQPKVDVNAVYKDGKAVNLGNVFSLLETLQEPTESFTADPQYPDANYTMLIVDPDAPSPETPILRYFLHLIRYDLKPNCIGGPIVNQGKTQAMYMLPTPLSFSLHRYVFLVYRQPVGTFTPPVQVPATIARNNFDLQSFVAQGKLTLVGGNFYKEGLNSTFLPGLTLSSLGIPLPL